MAEKAQKYGMLSGLVGTGEQAAGQGAALGVTTAGNIGNLITSAGAAQAGGVIGSTNALMGGINSITGAAGTTALMLALNNAGMFGAPGGGGMITPGNISLTPGGGLTIG